MKKSRRLWRFLEEKIQERFPKAGRSSSSHFLLPESAQNLAGVAFCVAGSRGIIFQLCRNLPEKHFLQGISHSHGLLDFSSELTEVP